MSVNRKSTDLSTHRRSIIHYFCTYLIGQNSVTCPLLSHLEGYVPKKRVMWKMVTTIVSTIGTYNIKSHCRKTN